MIVNHCLFMRLICFITFVLSLGDFIAIIRRLGAPVITFVLSLGTFILCVCNLGRFFIGFVSIFVPLVLVFVCSLGAFMLDLVLYVSRQKMYPL